MENHVENEYAKFWIEKDILFIVYKKEVFINLPVAIKVVEDRLLLQQGKPFLIFCDVRNVKSINKAARNYLAMEGSVLTKVVALLVEGSLTNAMSAFYIKTSVPAIITQAFTKKEDALTFLNTYSST
tara:strand:+ start:13868 stop:14248 length:381 start_codon:yes stop_codon:yes gene_type:complete